MSEQDWVAAKVRETRAHERDGSAFEIWFPGSVPQPAMELFIQKILREIDGTFRGASITRVPRDVVYGEAILGPKLFL